ncbi:hypothetical protein WA158_000586 [Blastocystis sp. Blastoise]
MSISSLFKNHTKSFHNFTEEEIKEIAECLSVWYQQNRRHLPWRGDKPPYTMYGNAVENIKKNNSKKLGQKTLQSFFTPVESADKIKKENGDHETKSEELKDNANQDISDDLLTVTPYHVWVSEIMLQQTRVDTVIPKYLEWMKRFPTIADLANASEDEVQGMWSGLGYYRRAKYLHQGAQTVMNKYNGIIPSTTKELLDIPGIGKYTAGAVSSLAFNNSDALVDGNVLRVFSRLRLICASPASTALNNYTWEVCPSFVKQGVPAVINQGLMELGAIVCTPKAPKCDICPLQKYCYWNCYCNEKGKKEDIDIEDCLLCEPIDEPITVESLPLTAPKTKVRDQYIYTVLFYNKEQKEYYLAPKVEKGVLVGKLKPIYIEDESISETQAADELYNYIKQQNTTSETLSKPKYIGQITHKFSHIHHYISLYTIDIDKNSLSIPNYKWYTYDAIQKQGLTTWLKKIIEKYTSFTSTGTIDSVEKKNKRTNNTNISRKRNNKVIESDSENEI